MPENYFRFKEFTIHQEKCSMKVCTDACLFGAFVANTLSNERYKILNCLDIGAGTGLLSLMYAQKNPEAVIDAVEIEENAYNQAKENFTRSKWNDRLNIFYSNAKNFVPGKKYDLIISNPPFYENELSSHNINKNIAKHDGGLLLQDLLSIIRILLCDNGCFAVLLPFHRIEYFENLAGKNNFFLQEKVLIRQTPAHNFFRGILNFSNTRSATNITELIIKNEDGNYTEKFTGLLKDYYLKL